MHRLSLLTSVIAATVSLAGCNNANVADVWGKPVHVPMLEPFQGKWQFDFDRTLAAWEAAGVPEQQIENARKRKSQDPPKLPPELENALRAAGQNPEQHRAAMRSLHADFTIDGHVALCSGLPQAEYRFFGLHDHDGFVCGKAWHHEDRHDPGDMSKCYVKLKLVGDELHFRVRMQESLPDSDRDLTNSPPIVLDSSSGCDADHPSGTDWSEWETFVFVRAGKSK